MNNVLGCKELLLLFCLIYYSSTNQPDPFCGGDSKSVCCQGYFWDSEQNTCKVCSPGYSGVNCNKKCPYPTYGTRCQDTCNCTETLCNITAGCLRLKNEGNTPLHVVSNGSNILNENSTLLVLKVCVSENPSSITVSKVNLTMLTFIQLFGVLAAILIGANVYISIYNHLEKKRKTANEPTNMHQEIIQ